MTIYDVPKLTEVDAWERVRALLDRHSVLQRIYDDATLAELIRRRQSITNHLLFWLVLPADDGRSVGFWSPIVDDLTTLEGFGAIDAFRDKMRLEEKERLTSWRTELWFAAWLVRNGIAIILEPPVGDKRPEFVTETTPPTWWEVKSPLELQEQRDEEAAVREVQRLLREIPEPFVLHIERIKLKAADVARAVKDIRAQIRAFAQGDGEPPVRFESGGLVVGVGARTKTRPTGYLGTTSYGYVFGDQHAEQLAEKIRSAIPQLPDDGAGVVVIDRTLSNWNHEEDAVEACFGVEGLAFVNNNVVHTLGRGFFRPDSGTRVSVVVSYSRHPMHWEHKDGYELLFIHNPFARTPLPEDLFRFPGVRHKRLIDNGDGTCRFETTGDGIIDADAG